MRCALPSKKETTPMKPVLFYSRNIGYVQPNPLAAALVVIRLDQFVWRPRCVQLSPLSPVSDEQAQT